MTRFELIIAVVLIPIVVFFAYAVFVVTPVSVYAEAECLRNGYPKYHVTIGLERYCSNFDGAVTVKVTKQ
jgi:hypothetical protein